MAVGVHPAVHLDTARRLLHKELADLSTVRSNVSEAVAYAVSVTGGPDRTVHSPTLPLRRTPGLELMGRAVCVDHVAEIIAARTGAGVVVDIGGFLVAHGPAPAGGWWVTVGDGAGIDDQRRRPELAVHDGALASSGPMHPTSDGVADLVHLHGGPVEEASPRTRWRLVTVAAATCVEAAAWTLAAHTWGACARSRLELRGLPARLVADDGAVVVVGRWIDSSVTGAHPAGSARGLGIARTATTEPDGAQVG